MQSHEYANIFPMMNQAEFDELCKDMAKNGYRPENPIITYEGKILDGRNRFKASETVGILPMFTEYGGGDPLGFVLSQNLHRRHLNESQRGVVASKLANMGLGDNQYKSGSANLQSHSQADAAKILNVSPRTVATIKAVEKEAPEFIPMIESGEMSAHQAQKTIKENKRREYIEAQKEEIDNNGIEPPTGLFDVLSIDPPWPYGTKYDASGRRAANPYPEMSLEEIKAIVLPAATDCVLWLWTTHKFMRYSFEILDEWGFRDVAILTWEKDRMGLGEWLRSQTEFCIMAVKGKPLVDLTNQTTILHGKAREHSRKPDEFYEMVNSLCVGRKLDYFSREPREGWCQYGNELEKFTNG